MWLLELKWKGRADKLVFSFLAELSELSYKLVKMLSVLQLGIIDSVSDLNRFSRANQISVEFDFFGHLQS